ncbi:MAG: DNA helicase [Deltaproteobacteria bacterium]|nr:MAG: DNA helicase [Deltaproteobacteria bacterium]
MSFPSQPRIAMTSDFMKRFRKLEPPVAARLLEKIRIFEQDPNTPGLDFKMLTGMPSNVRSMRVDKQYRAVLIAPEHGNTYALVWVDNHDEAREWAQRRSFEINPETGAFQIYSVQEAERAVGTLAEPTDAPGDAPPDLFAAQRDRELVRLGVPGPLLPSVRSIRDAAGLEAIQPHIPQETWEALYSLATGDSYADVVQLVEDRRAEAERRLRDRRSRRPEFGEASPLAEALEGEAERAAREAREAEAARWERAFLHPDSQRHLLPVESSAELAEVLDRPFEEWRLFLHPSQSQLVQWDLRGPARVLGGAGTGKTVVALHRMKWLAERVFAEEGQRLLFTTFTTNLPREVSALLDGMVTREARERIDVVNLHGWARGFLERQGLSAQLAPGERLRALWEEVVPDGEFPVSFYRDEWAQVVQRHGLRDQRSYLLKPREGRGAPLGRAQRREVWKVMEAFRARLEERGWMEPADLSREAANRLRQPGQPAPYAAVVVDEAQDFDEIDFRLVAALAGIPEPGAPAPEGWDAANRLFIVGDPHQRIYNRRVVLRRCGIDIQGRARRLRINYRTTEEIRRWAVALIEGVAVDDLDGEADTLRGYVSLMRGAVPTVRHFAREEQEHAWLVEQLGVLLREGPDGEAPRFAPREVCVALPRVDDVRRVAEVLRAADLPVDVIDRQGARGEGVRVATMHRVKGLEFRAVMLAGLHGGWRMEAPEPGEVPETAQAAEDRARALLYVVATRARELLLVSGWGTPHPALGEAP